MHTLHSLLTLHTIHTLLTLHTLHSLLTLHTLHTIQYSSTQFNTIHTYRQAFIYYVCGWTSFMNSSVTVIFIQLPGDAHFFSMASWPMLIGSGLYSGAVLWQFVGCLWGDGTCAGVGEGKDHGENAEHWYDFHMKGEPFEWHVNNVKIIWVSLNILNGEDNDQASLKTGYAAQLGGNNDQPFDGMGCPIRQTNIEEQTLLPLRTWRGP